MNRAPLFRGKARGVRPQGAKMDLIKRSLPKQKSIKSLMFIPQGFKRTINENPPRGKFFFDRFGFLEQGSNWGPLD